MKPVCVWGGILGLLLAFGCSQAAKKQSAEELKGRLDAANALTDLGKRNDALVAVAEDAAESGVGHVVLLALNTITDLDLRNKVAASCALKLAKNGDTKVATTVAGLITDLKKKDEVLGKITNNGS